VRLLAACAPSRAIRESDIDPDRAIRFVRESFPGMFPDEPSLSLPHEGVKFTVDSLRRSCPRHLRLHAG
jgi:hypothetical protein